MDKNNLKVKINALINDKCIKANTSAQLSLKALSAIGTLISSSDSAQLNRWPGCVGVRYNDTRFHSLPDTILPCENETGRIDSRLQALSYGKIQYVSIASHPIRQSRTATFSMCP